MTGLEKIGSELGLSAIRRMRDGRIGLLFFGRSGVGRKDGSWATLLYDVCARVRAPSQVACLCIFCTKLGTCIITPRLRIYVVGIYILLEEQLKRYIFDNSLV